MRSNKELLLSRFEGVGSRLRRPVRILVAQPNSGTLGSHRNRGRAMRVSLAFTVALIALLGFGSAAAQEGDGEYVQLVNEYFLTTSVYPQERAEIQLTTVVSTVFCRSG